MLSGKLRESRRDMARDRQKASWQAQVAFYLSIVTAAFSIFQWWHGQRQTQITTAIEFTKLHAKPLDQETIDAVSAVMKGERLDRARIIKINNLAIDMEYIAHLSNSGKIDDVYLAASLRCMVWVTDAVLVKVATYTNFNPPFVAIPIFARRTDTLCRSYENMFRAMSQSN